MTALPSSDSSWCRVPLQNDEMHTHTKYEITNVNFRRNSNSVKWLTFPIKFPITFPIKEMHNFDSKGFRNFYSVT